MSITEKIIGLGITPFIMIIIGVLWRKHYPKTINWIYGYRTFRAMKSQEVWEFAHRFSGKMMLRSGVAMMIFSAALLYMLVKFDGNSTLDSLFRVWLPIQPVVFVVPIATTEIALNKNFDKEGNPRSCRDNGKEQ